MFAVLAGMILVTAAFTGSTAAAEAILLEFSSPHCPPCQAMKPVLDQLERSGVPIRHVDAVAEPHLAARYGIRKTPTFIVVSGGKEVTRLVGTQTLAELRAALAIDPSGRLVPTGAKSKSFDEIPAPADTTCAGRWHDGSYDTDADVRRRPVASQRADA